MAAADTTRDARGPTQQAAISEAQLLVTVPVWVLVLEYPVLVLVLEYL